MGYSKDKKEREILLGDVHAQFILRMTILVAIITASEMIGGVIRIQPITLSKGILWIAATRQALAKLQRRPIKVSNNIQECSPELASADENTYMWSPEL